MKTPSNNHVFDISVGTFLLLEKFLEPLRLQKYGTITQSSRQKPTSHPDGWGRPLFGRNTG